MIEPLLFVAAASASDTPIWVWLALAGSVVAAFLALFRRGNSKRIKPMDDDPTLQLIENLLTDQRDEIEDERRIKVRTALKVLSGESDQTLADLVNERDRKDEE